MDHFQNFSGQFNPQLYESSNVPPSNDKLFAFSGFQAGLMTNNANMIPSSSSSSHLPQHQIPQQQRIRQQQLQQHHQQQQQHVQQAQSQPQQQPNPYLHQQQQQQQQQQLQQAHLQQKPISMQQQQAPPPADNFVSNPIPTQMEISSTGTRYSGMYANTGFDMLSILSRVANRPNPQIDLGPVDLSCSFVVVDAKQYDFPIVYASPMFERLTGYAPSEAIGRNCRFLQAPDGRVAIGSKRKYTDNTTVYHIKTHMVQGKESQSSIINYRKTGQPFVNLLTVIPIGWESDEIDYFIGLQVDLVEQPNSIFQSMKDGTYTVNYRNSVFPPAVQGMNIPPEMYNHEGVEEWTRAATSPKPMYNTIASSNNNALPMNDASNTSNATTMRNGNNNNNTTLTTTNATTTNTTTTTTSSAVINPSDAEPPMDVETLIKEASTDEGKFRRCWHELLLDQSPDFIHVLTIKGIFLYCSDSTQQVLEYEPAELVGKSLKAICHPSDITTVMRELKQSSSDSTEPVNLIYRVRRKNSGYMWIECCGKLRNEDGRGRKYVVLSGRERPVYQLPKNALAVGNKAHETHIAFPEHMMPGMEDHEFWGKLSADGLLLYVSNTCANILGSPPADIVGTSLYQLMRSNRTTDLTRALAEVKEGKVVYLRHALLNNTGVEVMVATTFYPDGKASLGEQPSFVLMQTKFIDDESALQGDDESIFVAMDPDVKKKGKADISLPGVDSNGQITPLPHRVAHVERMVEELDIGRDANWQYELHQLRISNKKLRDELGSLLQKAKQVEGKEETAACGSCFRRLPGTAELPEYASDEPLLCNTCSFREMSQQMQQQ